MSSTTEPPSSPHPPTPRSIPGSPPAPPVLRAPGLDGASRQASVPEWHRLHLYQIQPVRDLLVVAVIIGILYLGYVLRPVTIPILLALALAYLFEPLIKVATRSGHISRMGAAAAILVLAAVVVVVPVTVGVGFAAVQGTQYAAGLAQDIRRLRASVDNPDDAALRAAVPAGAWTRIRDYLVELEEGTETPAPGGGEEPDGEGVSGAGDEVAGAGEVAGVGEVGDVTPDEAPEGVRAAPAAARAVEGQELRASVARRVVEWLELNAAGIGEAIGRRAIGTGASAVGAAVGALTSIGYVLFAGLLTGFFFFFFSTGWGKTLAFWESLVPEARRGQVFDLVAKMDRVIAGFVRGRLTIVGLLAVYMTLTYWIIGVPAPLVLGPIIGLLFIVPFVHIIGVPIAMLLMWLEPSSGFQGQWWWIVFAPIGVYLIGQIVDDYVLSPIIQGKSTDMDTPTILFASLAGGILAGVYGLLLAIPVAACIKILIKELVWPRVHAWVQGRAKDLLPIEEGTTEGA